MFERLMVEDLVHWARDYKVGGQGVWKAVGQRCTAVLRWLHLV